MSNSEDSPFNMGDKVTPKILGFPGVGLIVGAISGAVYDYYCADLMTKIWRNKYPEWEDKYVFLVLFAEDRKPCRLDEFKTLFTSSAVDIEDRYKILGTTKIITYPEDDLEIFDKWEDFKDEK